MRRFPSSNPSGGGKTTTLFRQQVTTAVTAVHIICNTQSANTQQATSILLDVGLCALTLGRMEEAEVLYRRAWAIESEHLGIDHPDVMATARALEMFAPYG